MNRKLFLLVLLLPVALFATDRLTSTDTPDGGGKEKKKTTTEAKQTQPTILETQTEAADESTPVVKEKTVQKQAIASDPNMKDVAATISASLSALDKTLDAQRDKEQTVYLYDESIDEKLSAWIDEAVTEPLKSANPLKINLERSFSRCTSGYRVFLTTQDGKLDNGGWIMGDEGCHPRPLGQFEYDFVAQTVKVHVGIDGPLIPLDQYLTYLKAALA